jgi:hypothetical protein
MRKSFLFILSFVLSLQFINAQDEKVDMDMMNKIPQRRSRKFQSNGDRDVPD